MDDVLEDSATPQQISEAVKRELSQVESMIKDLSPTGDKAQQSMEAHGKQQPSSIFKLQKGQNAEDNKKTNPNCGVCSIPMNAAYP